MNTDAGEQEPEAGRQQPGRLEEVPVSGGKDSGSQALRRASAQ